MIEYRGTDKISSNSIIFADSSTFISNNSGGYENGKLWRVIVMAIKLLLKLHEGLNKIV